MTRRLLVAAAAVLALVASGNGAQAVAAEDAIFGSGIARAMRPMHLPPEVRRLADIAYGNDARQRIDVYLPEHAERAPVIVMVHGGAWMVGNKGLPQVVENKVRHWVTRGAIFVSVGYRLVPQVTVPEQADDVAHALALVQTMAASWGGDPARVVLMGHSAGAHLVALLTASPPIAKAAGASPWLGTVVLDSAALNLTGLMRQPHARFYDRVFGRDAATWPAASPIDALDRLGTSVESVPPMLLVCSTQRPDRSCAQSSAFATRAVARGVRAEVSEQDLSHGDVNDTLGLPGRETEAVDSFLASVGWHLR